MTRTILVVKALQFTTTCRVFPPLVMFKLLLRPGGKELWVWILWTIAESIHISFQPDDTMRSYSGSKCHIVGSHWEYRVGILGST